MSSILTKKSNREHSFDFMLAEIVGIEKAILLKNISYWCEENERRKISSMYHSGTWWTSESLTSLSKKYRYMKRGNLSRWLHNLCDQKFILMVMVSGVNYYAVGPVYAAWDADEDWQQVFQNETGKEWEVFQNETVGVSKRNSKVFQNETTNKDIEIPNVDSNVELLAENEFPQPVEPGSEEDQKKESPQIAPPPPAGPSVTGSTKIRVTIIEGHEEEIEIDQPLPKKRKQPASDHFIKKMATTFEGEHRKHFKDHEGEWIGFTWQAKEFPALKNIKNELERRFNQKLQKAPTESELLQSWELFLTKAANCDKFILNNCFTPSKLWGQFQSIINKIYAESTPISRSGEKPTVKDRNDAAVRRMLTDIPIPGS